MPTKPATLAAPANNVNQANNQANPGNANGRPQANNNNGRRRLLQGGCVPLSSARERASPEIPLLTVHASHKLTWLIFGTLSYSCMNACTVLESNA